MKELTDTERNELRVLREIQTERAQDAMNYMLFLLGLTMGLVFNLLASIIDRAMFDLGGGPYKFFAVSITVIAIFGAIHLHRVLVTRHARNSKKFDDRVAELLGQQPVPARRKVAVRLPNEQLLNLAMVIFASLALVLIAVFY